MKELLDFLKAQVPAWLALLAGPLNQLVEFARRPVAPRTHHGGGVRTLANGDTWQIGERLNRRQLVVTADGTLSLQNASGDTIAKVQSNTSWTIETTDALTINNDSGSSASVQVCEIVYPKL